MNEQVLVSVIIIFLNGEKFIEEAIESVLAQTYANWELLLVDDGSTDASTALARSYAGQHPTRVRYLEHNEHQNRGMPASRNLGIAAARGDTIAFLDADDVWLPHKLERQVAILKAQPEAALVYGPDQFWYSWTGNPSDSQRDFIGRLGDVQPNTLVRPPKLVPLFLQRQVVVPCPTNILVRRSAVEAVGGFEELFRGKYSIYEDQAFYAKLFLEKSVFVSNECWDRYRQHPDSSCAIARRLGQKQAAREFFLNWLVSYYRDQKVVDPEIWKALQQELWPFQHPHLHRLFTGVRFQMGRVEALLQGQG